MDNQKHVVMTSDKYKEMEDELDDNAIVKIVDEDNSVENDEQVNVPKLQADVQRFMDKLNLGQFEAIIKKIDKPVEKAELIAAFAERIGVPRNKLAVVLSSLKAISKETQGQQETTRARMKKSDLVEHVLKTKK